MIEITMELGVTNYNAEFRVTRRASRSRVSRVLSSALILTNRCYLTTPYRSKVIIIALTIFMPADHDPIDLDFLLKAVLT